MASLLLVSLCLIAVKPEDCVVFEDSQAGIQAANRANMISIGIGEASILNEADHVFNDFTEINTELLYEISMKKIKK